MLLREASEAFSKDLLLSLLQLKDWRNILVWSRAEKLFQEKVAATLPKNELCRGWYSQLRHDALAKISIPNFEALNGSDPPL